jgi:ribosomal protein S13
MVAVSGVDTVRGIGFQQAHAILAALDILDDADLGSLRVEGIDDVVDIEVFSADG